MRRSFPADPFAARRFADGTRQRNRRLWQGKARSRTVRNSRQYLEKLIEPHVVMPEQIPFTRTSPFRHRQNALSQILYMDKVQTHAGSERKLSAQIITDDSPCRRWFFVAGAEWTRWAGNRHRQPAVSSFQCRHLAQPLGTSIRLANTHVARKVTLCQ